MHACADGACLFVGGGYAPRLAPGSSVVAASSVWLAILDDRDRGSWHEEEWEMKLLSARWSCGMKAWQVLHSGVDALSWGFMGCVASVMLVAVKEVGLSNLSFLEEVGIGVL